MKIERYNSVRGALEAVCACKKIGEGPRGLMTPFAQTPVQAFARKMSLRCATSR